MEPGLPKGAVWRNDLPLDAAQAERGLEQAEASLEAIRATLEASGVQVEIMTRRRTGGTSFSISQPAPEPPLFGSLPSASAMTAGLPEPERERLAVEQRQRLLQLERDTLGMLSFSVRKEEIPSASFSVETGWDEVSYGLLDDISGKWNQATRQFQDFIARLGQAIGNFAWVETRVSGQLLARTSIGWKGDMDTTWQVQPKPEQFQQHKRTLQLALASRIMLLRTFTAVTTNAVKLSMLIAAPGGAVLALPTSLNLIHQIMNERAIYLQQIKEIQNGN
jgi:hypothetical protein